MRANTKTLAQNAAGRDFVVGDIHGCFDLVDEALREVGFQAENDRLLCVGDLVDRGPQSAEILSFLARPYVHAVMGNHEWALLAAYEFDPALAESINARDLPAYAQRAVFGRMGAHWWLEISQARQRQILEVFQRLPIAMEVPTARGLVGLVHADVLEGLAWDEFKLRLDAQDDHVIQAALWGRSRAHSDDCSGVDGVGRVFCGHTPQDKVTRRGNVYFVDTGAVYGVTNGPGDGHLSVLPIPCSTEVIAKSGRWAGPSVHVWDDAGAGLDGVAFGPYAAPRARQG